ncbi:acyl-CoA dehydrogenase/oxidase [Naematelia encephala]|uniref:Acyl-CoA dehydrogenase/oxidase n=1 Tax=Naematelia encephala TaxID=71784 RepID=A0A1Y2B684_9TREE|nr:acyl-CoA dehydrogenase/oxidase [Naematelia encephala]
MEAWTSAWVFSEIYSIPPISRLQFTTGLVSLHSTIRTGNDLRIDAYEQTRRRMSKHRVLEYISAGTWDLVEPLFSDRGKEILDRLIVFLQDEILPAETHFHSQISSDPQKRWQSVPAILDTLKTRAKELGLWNLWLSGGEFQHLAQGGGGGLTNLEYAVMAEIMGHSIVLYPQATNCSAPDTGNMEVFARFGTKAQKARYLKPLLDGEIRSSFAMTEYGVASSDATNLKNTTAVREKDELVVNGHKWWISGAGDPRNALHIVLAMTDPHNQSPYRRHSLVLVDPHGRGVNVVRPMTVYGYDDAPEGHCEVKYEGVRIGLHEGVVGGEAGLGRGFEMLQARLGPGRLHHCMRAVGVASRALSLVLLRASDPARKTFGKQLREHGTVLADVANSRAEIDQARLLVLAAARRIDVVGAKGALKEIGIAKFMVPAMALRVVDRAIQVYGAEGISQDQPLAAMYASLRTLRFADGPDEVHVQQIGKREMKDAEGVREKAKRVKDKEESLKAKL